MANIEVEVHGEALWALRGQLPFGEETAPSVWVVNDSDFERAEELMSAFHDGEATPLIEEKPWRCRCGEENEGQFTECWSCGKARPNYDKVKT